MAPTTKVTRTQNGGIPVADVTPEEAAAIRSAVGGKEQAPSSRVQAAYTNWRQAADQLGSPYEVEKIPISKLRAMRRDPMLGFGLSFTKMPHVRAKWFVNAKSSNGPNAQIAAHLDHDLRRIYPSFVLQILNSLDFGFQAVAKRFELRTPSGTYIETNPDTGEQEEKPIWSEGSVEPIAWKPFVALRPEGVEPIWNSAGEFDGIEYSPAAGSSAPGGVGAVATGGGKGGNDKEKTYKIDLYHSLWFTNEKDSNFGSIFGYPRLGYSYRYWWSYWFRWAIADRAFERKADPSVLVRHPDGEFLDENTGERLSYAEYALSMGERMRSGGVIALPSDVYEDANGGGTVRQWEIEFTKDATNFDPFDKSFEYLDVQKLRSLFIPEQAFFEGKGGTSSRNVAAEMGSTFIESQAVLASQIVEHVNRYLIPQWLAVNYPEFVANEGGTAEMVLQGFADEDVEFTNQIIQLIGQQESGMREVLKLVDLKRILESKGTPIASYADQQRREAQAAEEAAAASVPEVAAIPGQQVGTVPTSTGFAYIEPRDVIYLSENGTDFIEGLPNSPHYEDKAVKGFSRRLWNVYRDLYADEYETIISDIEASEDPIEFSNEDLSLAVTEVYEKAKDMVGQARISRLWPQTLELSQNILGKIMRQASRFELKRSGLQASVDADRFDAWMKDHLTEFAPKVAETTRTEVRDFLAARMAEGISDRVELARLAREHFTEFPKWKADRLVRTEVRDAYNTATLYAAEAAGVELVQALDAQTDGPSDPDCEDRDGRIFTLDEARAADDHPNGTLGWRIVPVMLTIERSDEEDGADFDRETNVLTLSNDVDEVTERRILKTVVDSLLP